jgi:glutaminyl-peptide cyclotransferase
VNPQTRFPVTSSWLFCSMFIRLVSFATLAVALGWGCQSEPQVQRKPNVEQQAARPLAVIPLFEGARALEHVRRQVAFGPRVPRSAAHDSCRDFLVSHLRTLADAVSTQDFNVPGYDNLLPLTNVIASFGGGTTTRIMFCAHWDSRPRAEMDPDPAKRSHAIPGANDGASGVAVLLELARIMRANPPPVGVDIVLLDGEDYGKEGDLGNYCLGARYFAKHPPRGFVPQFGILLDMVGDPNAVFAKDPASKLYAPEAVNAVWNAAAQVGATMFVSGDGPDIFDDHIPMNVEGMRVIDIIDAQLIGHKSVDPARKYWHTTQDTPDRCSAETLGRVGSVLANLIYTR